MFSISIIFGEALDLKNGPYILVKAPADFPGKKYRGVYAYEHTIVWWLHTRIIPPEGYQIHHINGCRTDNRIANLELVNGKTHTKLHNATTKKKAFTLLVCDWCKKPFQLATKNYRVKSNQGQNNFYCSRLCLYCKQREAKQDVLHCSSVGRARAC